MKIFVFSDNINIFKAIYKILRSLDYNIDYFCSPESKQIFKEFTFIKPKNIKSNYEVLLSYDLGFSIHSKQIFPNILVEKVLCINLHPGYNPHNRGIYPQSFSIINKLPIGATLHIMDSNIDSGDIIEQIQVKIEPFDTSLSLYKKILRAEIKLFKKNIHNILNHNFKVKKLKTKGNYNSKRDFCDLCRIDLEKTITMQEALDYLRALSHKPHNNAYFIDANGNKVYVRLEIRNPKNNIEKLDMGGGSRVNLPSPFLQRSA
ncbi:dTDP-4-amino-4,6-dideoxyglucose formyltransferase [Helicobacter sp. 16-1353]|uniref:dTDP-4-amino-4,6-dideoxyglucose formyltransferase n=1 Tax=Helicobacter sp. 16-1353 TaxID=2004996 RepID=UPI001C657488|nr:dTDP-4-amino-4,6-dideoxyglucose formyltransferase [Helicobacter sp. 16-1353]